MSDCDVCIGVDDIDEVYTESETKTNKPARREHKCYECGGTIAKGELHEHAAGRLYAYWGDGDNQEDWDMYHTCNLCVEIRDKFSCGNSWYYGQLWEEMEEYVFPSLTTATKCFRELSTAARHFVFDRWRKWRGL